MSVPSSQVQCLWDNHLDRDYTHTKCNCEPIVMGTGIVNAPCWCCGMVGMDSAENNYRMCHCERGSNDVVGE